nr:MAG TPA: Trp-operon Leader Peptide [Caudoviricetes sp.]
MKPGVHAMGPGPPDRPQEGPQDRRGHPPSQQGDHVHLPDGEGSPQLDQGPKGGKGGGDANKEREGASHIVLRRWWLVSTG